MANPRGTFAPELLPEGWFDETQRPEGWFSQDFLEPASGGGSPYTITVTSGSVVLTGSSVSLRRALRLSVSSAAIALTGSSVNFRRGLRVTANTAAVTLSGTSVALRKASNITVGTAAVTLSGTSVNLSYSGTNKTITVGSAAITLAGSSVALRTSRQIAAATNAVTLAGSSVNLKAARNIAATSNQITLSGSSVDLTYTPVGATHYTLTVDSAAIVLTGSSVDMIYTPAVIQTQDYDYHDGSTSKSKSTEEVQQERYREYQQGIRDTIAKFSNPPKEEPQAVETVAPDKPLPATLTRLLDVPDTTALADIASSYDALNAGLKALLDVRQEAQRQRNEDEEIAIMFAMGEF